MEIGFARRPETSKFHAAVTTAIREDREALDQSHVVVVDLEPGGYAGRITVTIRPSDDEYFDSDWNQADESRFPRRIRLAATVLRQERCHGRFEIFHDDGQMEIKRA